MTKLVHSDKSILCEVEARKEIYQEANSSNTAVTAVWRHLFAAGFAEGADEQADFLQATQPAAAPANKSPSIAYMSD